MLTVYRPCDVRKPMVRPGDCTGERAGPKARMPENSLTVAERQALVRGVMALCRSRAKRYCRINFDDGFARGGRGELFRELYSAALEGACYAARIYQPDKGKFSTYSHHWIINRICDVLRQYAPCGYRHYRDGRAWPVTTSLNNEANEDGSQFVDLMVITENSEPDVPDRTVKQLLRGLDARARDIVIARVIGGRGLRELAAEYGLSKEGVRQLIKRALEKQRAVLAVRFPSMAA